MATSAGTRFLSKSGDDRKLALTRLFESQVLVSFREETLLWNSLNVGAGITRPGANSGQVPGIISSKDITEGFSHQFLMFAEDIDPEYHTPGTELLGQKFVFDDNTITVDDILVKHHDVPLDQKMLSHFDVMTQVASSIGRSLAKFFDKKLIQLGINAAYTAALTKDGQTVHSGGNQVERVDAQGAYGATGAYPANATGADQFRDDASNLASLMDVDNVPEGPGTRFLFITPEVRRVLGFATSGLIFDKDLSRVPNSLNDRAIGVLEGFTVLVTNHIPTTNITTGPSKYQGDFSHSGTNGQPVALALAGAREGAAAIGYVHAGGVRVHVEDDHRRNTTFAKGQIIQGADVLAPWCAGVIHVDDA